MARSALLRQPSTFVSSRAALLRLSAGRRRPALQQLLPLVAAPARTGVGRRLSSTSSLHGADKLPLEADTNNSWGGNLRGLGHNNYLGKILNARVYEVAVETPLQPITRMTASEAGLPNAAINSVFSGEEGEVFTFPSQAGDLVMIMQLKSVTPPDETQMAMLAPLATSSLSGALEEDLNAALGPHFDRRK